MNRENKRKTFEKGYYKTHACNDTFTCKRCEKLSSNRVAADDNPMKLMSIAMKPLCSPPFPLDYLEEMTALMGGDGRIR